MTRARDLADGALYKITPSTSGNVLTSDGSNWTSSSNPTELPAHGSDGNILTSTGSAWASEANPLPAHGTSGNVLTSNGSAWTSATPAPADLVNDTSPQLGADLDMQSHSISSGVLPVKNTGSAPSELRLYCESSNAHYVGLKSPAHSAFSGNHTITMPPNTGTSGQFLSTDGNGVTSWSAAGGGSWDLLSTATVTSNVAQVDFNGSSAGFDSTKYQSYCLIWPYWGHSNIFGGVRFSWLRTNGGSVSLAPRHKFSLQQFYNSVNSAIGETSATYINIANADGPHCAGQIFFTMDNPPYTSGSNSLPAGSGGPRMNSAVSIDANFFGQHSNRTMMANAAGNHYDTAQNITGVRLWGENYSINKAKFYLYGIKL